MTTCSSRRHALASAAWIFVLFIASSTARAQTPVVWTFNGDGLWSTPGNWSSGAVPDGSGFDVTVDDGDSIVTVTLDSSRSVRTLVLGDSDTLNIQGNTTSVSFTSAEGFTDSGNIVLTNTAATTSRLSVSSGALTIAPSGLLRFQSGGGERRMDANLINNGTVQINKDTTFDKFNGVYTNNAGFSITGGATLAISGTGTLNQNAGILDLDGTLDLTGGVFNHNGGTLDFGTNALIQNGNFNFTDGTIVGTPKLVNTTFTLGPGSGSASILINDNNTLASNINNGQTLTVEATNASVALNSLNVFTLNGNLILTGTGVGTSRLSVTNGAITVGQFGLLRFNVGSGGRRMDANLVNNGTVQINRDATFDKFNGVYNNNASLSVTGGATLAISGTGTLNQNAGTLDLDGTLELTGGTLNHTGGTLDFGTNALIQNGNFNFTGGTIVGTPKLISTTFTLGPGTNPVSIQMNDNNTIASHINGSQQVTVEATEASVVLNSVNAFTNNGNLILTGTGVGTSRLSVTNGAITVGQFGLLRFNVGSGGRRVDADLINNGTVQINKNTTFDKFQGVYNNNAALSVTGGATLAVSGTGTLYQNAGTLDLDGTLELTGGTFNHTGGTLDFGTNALIQNGNFNFTGGTVVGTPKLISTTFTLGPGTNPVSILMNDNNTIASHINGSQQVTVEATDASVVLNSANAFTNSGNLILTGDGAGTSRLSVTNGAITVSQFGLLRFNVGTGGRRMDADLINNGTVQINRDTTFDKFNGVATNNAALSVNGGTTLTISGTGTLNQNAGTFDLDGAFDLVGSTFNHNGGTFDFGTNAIIQNGSFNYNGGTILGVPKLKNLTLALGPTSGPASFLMNDTNALASNVNANQIINVSATDGSITFSSADPFSNSGSILLRSTGVGTSRLTVSNGALTNGASGLIHFQSGLGSRRFDGDLINIGTVRVSNDTFFDKFNGSYTNNGTLQVDAGATLSIVANGTLTNQSVSTLNGGKYDIAGTLIYPNAFVATNQAEIILHGPGAAIQSTSGSDAISPLTTNGANGKLRLLNNRNFSTTQPFTNSGLLELGGGNFQAPSVSSSGEIRGTGNFFTTVTSSGVVAPGSPTGTLAIGSYVQTSAGSLSIELAGALNGQYDKLATDFTNLAGALNVSLAGSFHPQPGDSFDILDLGSRTGTFGTIQLPLANQITWNTSQLYVNGIISVSSVLYTGDFNRDNQITAADIPAMLKALTNLSSYTSTNSLTPTQLVQIGDFDGSGTVTNRDIQGLLALVGSFGFGSVASVPEPSAILLATFGFVLATASSSLRKNAAAR